MSGTLNKVILIGNVGDDMKTHQFSDGNKIGRLPLATSESYNARETGERVTLTEWHNLVIRNTKVVDIFEKYVRKGDKLYIEGKIRTRKWQDNTGADRYTTEIHVDNFTFLTPKNQSGGGQTGGDYNSPKTETQKPSGETPDTSSSFEDDGLPF